MSKPNPKLKLGATFSRWTIIQELPRKNSDRWFLCRCSCPPHTEKPVRGANLLNKNSQSCGCLQKEKLVNRCLKRPFESLYNRLKRAARLGKHEISLTYTQFLKFTLENYCHYCGSKLYWRGYCVYNLDRKDNTKGYHVKNLVPCCYVCNKTKGDTFTYQEFLLFSPVLRFIKHLREHPLDAKNILRDAEVKVTV